MTACNAHLTTATETDEVLVTLHGDDLPSDIGKQVQRGTVEGDVFKRVGDRLVRVDLHTLTCEQGGQVGGCYDVKYDRNLHAFEWLTWSDDTRGATPHVPTVEVPDHVLDAALDAYRSAVIGSDRDHLRSVVRAVLTAAQQEDV